MAGQSFKPPTGFVIDATPTTTATAPPVDAGVPAPPPGFVIDNGEPPAPIDPNAPPPGFRPGGPNGTFINDQGILAAKNEQGEWLTLNPANTGEDGRMVVDVVGGQDGTPPEVKPVAPVSKSDAAWSGIKSGALFGGDDEISGFGGAVGNWLGRNAPEWLQQTIGSIRDPEAALNGATFRFDPGTGQGFGADYVRDRDQEDANKNEAYNQHPGAYIAGAAVGAVPSLVLPGARAAQIPNTAARLAALSGLGAGYGAIGGALSDDADRLGGAETGGAIGAALGPVLPIVGRGVANVASRVGQKLGINAMTQRGMSGIAALMSRAPQDVNALAAGVAERRGLGMNPTLTDVVDEQGAGAIRAAGTKGAARTTAQNYGSARRASLPDDVASRAAPLSPESRPTNEVIDNIEAGRKFLADDQYNAIRDTEVPVTPDLQRILDTGAGRRALKEAIETSDKPEEVAAFLKSIVKSNEPSELDRAMSLLPEGMSDSAKAQVRAQLQARGVAGSPAPAKFTVDMLDRVKRNFDARGRSPDASGFTRQLTRMSNDLRDIGDKAAPGYAEARGNFQAQSGLVDAADVGQRVLSGDPDEFVAAANNLSTEPVKVPRMRQPEGNLTVESPPTDSAGAKAKMVKDYMDQYSLDEASATKEVEDAIGGTDPLKFITPDHKISYTMPDGKKITGTITRQPGNNEGVINIDGIKNWDEVSNTYGPGVMRDVMQEIRKAMPGLDTLRGFRVTGTRAGPAADDIVNGVASVDIRPRLRNGPSERQVAATAARRTIENRAETPRSALETADRVAYGRNSLNRIGALVGEDIANRVQRGMALTAGDARRAQFIAPNTGSQTASRMGDAADSMIDFGINAMSGKIGIIRGVANYVRSAGFHSVDADRLVTMATDPAQTDAAIAYIRSRGADATTARRIVRSIQNTATPITGRLGGEQDENTNDATRGAVVKTYKKGAF